MFDSRQYEWADLSLVIGGRPLTAFRGVKYTKKIEREPVYAKGRMAHSIQSGNVAIEGEIKLLQSEYEALIASGGGTILGLSVDALVAYGNPAEGNMMITDRIEGIRFTEENKEFNQGDQFMEITLPFVALDVKSQV
ncbi:MAG: hypothetical protein H3C36_02860 [Chitinophagaceae bacterium]|jgi:hypothetical protein|nr:hypothetical protein [Chitinophagaceae bacterium]